MRFLVLHITLLPGARFEIIRLYSALAIRYGIILNEVKINTRFAGSQCFKTALSHNSSDPMVKRVCVSFKTCYYQTLNTLSGIAQSFDFLFINMPQLSREIHSHENHWIPSKSWLLCALFNV